MKKAIFCLLFIFFLSYLVFPNINERLLYVIKNNDLLMVEEYLKAGANINYQNKSGETALILASKSGHYDVVKYLLDNNANVNIEDNYHYTALDYAEYKYYENIMLLLIENGAIYGNKDIYLPQHKISKLPIIPLDIIREKNVYPVDAIKQGIEGVVILELYIDYKGYINDIKILKDPGHGFAEAAMNALKGIKCEPALADGVPVSCRVRYPFRFELI